MGTTCSRRNEQTSAPTRDSAWIAFMPVCSAWKRDSSAHGVSFTTRSPEVTVMRRGECSIAMRYSVGAAASAKSAASSAVWAIITTRQRWPMAPAASGLWRHPHSSSLYRLASFGSRADGFPTLPTYLVWHGHMRVAPALSEPSPPQILQMPTQAIFGDDGVKIAKA